VKIRHDAASLPPDERHPRRGRDGKGRLRVAIYTFETRERACAHVRLFGPLEYLREKVEIREGVRYERGRPRIDLDILGEADLTVIQRNFPSRRTMGAIRRIFASGVTVVYDLDDLLLDLPVGHVSRAIVEKERSSITDVLSRADAVTVSTEELGDAVKPYNEAVYVLPNLIDESVWRSRVPQPSGPVVVGFAGTVSHDRDLAIVEDALIEISRRHGPDVAFRFMGCAREKIATLPAYSYLAFETSYRAYARALQGSGIEIGLIPVEDNSFNRCKSSIKWLEYAVSGIAGVCSNLPPYSRSVRAGETGLTVENRKEDWVEAVGFLIANEDARKRIREEARREALSRHSLSVGAAGYLETYLKILGGGKAGSAGKKRGTAIAAVMKSFLWNLGSPRRRLRN
jgi:glycosyltransferase involved in cell wall biosynthesis